MEACATAHHWARELTKLGHTVRLIPPSYVKAYVKRQKNDAADADDNRVRIRVPLWVGLCAGGLSGLLGIGGGVVMVPVLVNRVGFPIKRALGTSLVSTGFFALPATLTHAYFGGIAWNYAIPLAVGVIPGSRIGSALALRSNDRGLRMAVSLFLIAVAITLATKELIAWLG
jgi:uncharacterized membrane protein YfcA